jgi:fatty-acyl-CoA synthase/long-chain acyl-CoA synthetase
MNVYSSEVERVVNQHPSVALSACIGVPHPDWGEVVCVVISLHEGLSCTSEELIDFCKQRTSKYMVPKVAYFLDKFPLTPIGKIDKKELRKLFAQGILTI